MATVLRDATNERRTSGGKRQSTRRRAFYRVEKSEFEDPRGGGAAAAPRENRSAGAAPARALEEYTEAAEVTRDAAVLVNPRASEDTADAPAVLEIPGRRRSPDVLDGGLAAWPPPIEPPKPTPSRKTVSGIIFGGLAFALARHACSPAAPAAEEPRPVPTDYWPPGVG